MYTYNSSKDKRNQIEVYFYKGHNKGKVLYHYLKVECGKLKKYIVIHRKTTKI